MPNITNVTKTYLPDFDKYTGYLKKIYESGWVTNNGFFLQELEKKLAKYLGVKNLILVGNGTLALEVAYRALELNNSAITTPFSFVATTSSLVTNKIKPVFADINQKSLNIDPKNIKAMINSQIEAIVPVHVYGNACEVEEIDEIAKKNNLKVIYDASQAFGVNYKGESILSYGDISTVSFHATKSFHTIEGGAIIVNDDSLVEKIRCLINFGIKDYYRIPEQGINAKMNEFQAAMGLCMLDEFEHITKERKKIYQDYMQELSDILIFPQINKNCSLNYNYFPVVFDNESQLLKVQKSLETEKIYTRRYFYPSLDTLEYIHPRQYMPNSRDISSRILCLPIFVGLDEKIQARIVKTIRRSI